MLAFCLASVEICVQWTMQMQPWVDTPEDLLNLLNTLTLKAGVRGTDLLHTHWDSCSHLHHLLMLPVGARGARSNGAGENLPIILHVSNSLSSVVLLLHRQFLKQSNFSNKCLINGVMPLVRQRMEKQKWGMNVTISSNVAKWKQRTENRTQKIQVIWYFLEKRATSVKLCLEMMMTGDEKMKCLSSP